MSRWVLTRTDPWLGRFGDDVPACARTLLDVVSGPGLPDQGRRAEARRSVRALGVLRAQQGHAVAGLVEDVLSLRAAARLGPGDLGVDALLGLAVTSYVEELTALLASRATRDPLTGLPNRAAFEEAVLHEIAATGRHQAPSLLLVDLDRFKLVNDRDGHLAGDAVLGAVADVLRDNVRPGDVVCRLGGDEFAVVLPRTGEARALQVAGRLLLASRKAAGLSSPQARVTLSTGVGWLAKPSTSADLVALADDALYAVKAAGGDAVSARGRARVGS
jgi:diguanylate cyclase (GGDEF)-like protein